MIAAAECTVSSRSLSGQAALTVEVVDGLSAATQIRATNPLKLLVPQTRGQSVWAYASSFGGGLVAGDQTQLDLRVQANARCFFSTQASTKVYRNPELRPCGHQTQARLGAGSLLVFAPDPVQPFAASTYVQRQDFHLALDANLVLVDWFSAGRVARGERWQSDHFQSRNAVRRARADASAANEEHPADELLFLDSVILNSEDAALVSKHRMGRFNCFATMLLVGPALNALSTKILNDIGERPVSRQSSLLTSASAVHHGVVVRVAGVEVEAVGRELHRHLASLKALLGDDPWARRW